MKFQWHKRKLWKYLIKSSLLTLSLHLITTWIFINYKGINSYELTKFIFIIVLLGWFFFFELPLLILFFNHFNLSRYTVLEIKDHSFCIYYKKKRINFELNEIERVVLNLSPPSYYKRPDILYFGHFNYTTIELTNKIEINLSCLIIDRPKNVFEKNKIIRQKKNFPWIKKTLPNTTYNA
jgi:uncharacterized protein (UPF0216 family)